jgi:fumarylpyruvate hydrolase
MDYVFSPPPQVSVPVVGLAARFPVHRVYCVGRNYADHVAEMGGDPKSEPPVFFSKPASALVTDGAPVRYPQATTDLHHEVELVVALAGGGCDLSMAEAAACVFGYGVGIDFTRRDLQAIAKKHGRPWDTAKGFDQSAPLSALTTTADFSPSTDTVISLTVNGEVRQTATLGQMIWHVAEIIQQLSMLFELRAGDIIYTGTPAGVAATVKGDKLCAEISGLNVLDFEII